MKGSTMSVSLNSLTSGMSASFPDSRTRQHALSLQGQQIAGRAADSVEISDAARTLFQQNVAQSGAAGFSSAGKFSGIGVESLKRYANIGSGTGVNDLAALNASRLTLSSKIDSVLKSAGIRLDASDKLTITINANNEFAVAGIKDKKKAKAIAEALNENEKLALDLRKHFATGKTRRDSRTFDQIATACTDPEYLEQMRDILTDRGVRSFLIDAYLMENADISLQDLSLENSEGGMVSIAGMNDSLAALLENDSALGETIRNILENGETANTFDVSFEYANAMISDDNIEDETKGSIKDFHDKVMGNLAAFNDIVKEEEIERNGSWDPNNTQVITHFTVRITSGKGFEIVDLDKFSARQQAALHDAVSRSLSSFIIEQPSPNAIGQGDAKPAKATDFGAVVDAYIHQHQFEHGDTNDYQHMLEIEMGGSGAKAKVVSPEADAALENTIRQHADDMGNRLRDVFLKEGVDIGDGIEIEMDASGKLRVVGDISDANLRQAQNILTVWSKKQALQFPAAGRLNWTMTTVPTWSMSDGKARLIMANTATSANAAMPIPGCGI